jgi:hypothetical protein
MNTGISYARSTAKIFITGIMFKDPFKFNVDSAFGLKLTFNSITANSLIFKINSAYNSSIESVWVSYIIFSPTKVKFLSYGGLIKK